MRVHNSIKKIELIKPVIVGSMRNGKPSGFWYSIDDAWDEWAKDNIPEKLGDYQYELEIDQSKILILDNLMKIERFTKKYRLDFHEELDSKYWHIDWQKVSLDYSGVEINPYNYIYHDYYFWVYGWDCSSGVVWDVSAIKSFKEKVLCKTN